ncbi:tyrosine-protein kinase family protein [Mycobacterium sp. NPDC050041]|uniref:tyrosine-protein kinase family protein n=1 Tax=Mycobacterium sp. NPDC050041 TaxID=3364293 RepID=UPI003C2D73C1
MELTSKYRLEQVRRRWWVVAVGVALGVLAGLAVSVNAGTSYVGKSTVLLSGRAPEQDAVMVIGYLTLINDPGTVERLKNAESVPRDVTVEARTAGASPILSIEATARDPEIAQDAAETMAQAFSEDVNRAPRKGRETLLADLQNQLGTVAPLAPDGSANPYYTALLTQIDELKTTTTNELLSLNPRAGVTEISPATTFNVMTGALGGLLLGILAALGLAVLSSRLSTLSDIRNRTGVRPLVELPAGAHPQAGTPLREERLRELANTVDAECSPKPGVVVVTDAQGGSEARGVAEALAELSAKRGARTILVHADDRAGTVASPMIGGAGFNDAVIGSRSIDEILEDHGAESPSVIHCGTLVDNRHRLTSPTGVIELFEELRKRGDAIFVAAPAMSPATDASVLAAFADAAILVATRNETHVVDFTTAASMLRGMRTRLVGAVLVDTATRVRWSPRSRERRAASQQNENRSVSGRQPAPEEPAYVVANRGD